MAIMVTLFLERICTFHHDYYTGFEWSSEKPNVQKFGRKRVVKISESIFHAIPVSPRKNPKSILPFDWVVTDFSQFACKQEKLLACYKSLCTSRELFFFFRELHYAVLINCYFNIYEMELKIKSEIVTSIQLVGSC